MTPIQIVISASGPAIALLFAIIGHLRASTVSKEYAELKQTIAEDALKNSQELQKEITRIAILEVQHQAMMANMIQIVQTLDKVVLELHSLGTRVSVMEAKLDALIQKGGK